MFALVLGACQLINPEFDGASAGSESGSESESDTKPDMEGGTDSASGTDTSATSDTDSTAPDPTDSTDTDTTDTDLTDSGDGDGDTTSTSSGTTTTTTDGGDGDGDPFDTDTDTGQTAPDTEGEAVLCHELGPEACELEDQCIPAYYDEIDLFENVEWCYGGSELWIGCFDQVSCQLPASNFYCNAGNDPMLPPVWVTFWDCKDVALIEELALVPCPMPPGVMVECP